MSVPISDWWQIGASAFGGSTVTAIVNWRRARAKARTLSSKTEAEATRTLSEIIEEKLKTLIDGYEKRIADLTREVDTLRAEVIDLRKALDNNYDKRVHDLVVKIRENLHDGAVRIGASPERPTVSP